MSATFRCKVSGSLVAFEYEHDIQAMRTHPSYEEVVEQPVVVEETPVVVKKTRKTVTSVGE